MTPPSASDSPGSSSVPDEGRCRPPVHEQAHSGVKPTPVVDLGDDADHEGGDAESGDLPPGRPGAASRRAAPEQRFPRARGTCPRPFPRSLSPSFPQHGPGHPHPPADDGAEDDAQSAPPRHRSLVQGTLVGDVQAQQAPRPGEQEPVEKMTGRRRDHARQENRHRAPGPCPLLRSRSSRGLIGHRPRRTGHRARTPCPEGPPPATIWARSRARPGCGCRRRARSRAAWRGSGS